MKSLLLTACFVLTTAGVALATTSPASSCPEANLLETDCTTPLNDECVDDAVKISVKVDIGRKSKDCKRFGVCSVTISVEFSLAPRSPGWLDGEVGIGTMSRGDGSVRIYAGPGFRSEENSFDYAGDADISVDPQSGMRGFKVLPGTYEFVSNPGQIQFDGQRYETSGYFELKTASS